MQRVEVRLNGTNKLESFISDLKLKINDKVVVLLDNNEVFGEVVFVRECEKENGQKVLRLATKKDKSNMERAQNLSKKAYDVTKSLVEKLKLDMNIVNANYSLDLSKVVIEFVSENRVDFRELIKELVSNLKTRVELRQITSREQAQVVGGIGACGRMCCCATFLKDFEKVSMKMAKVQGLALNPSKISGACGRLMCCLEYENPFYLEVASKMPKVNTEVKTKEGVGVVVEQNVLKEKVSVKLTSKDGNVTIKEFNLDEIKFEKDRAVEHGKKDKNETK